MSKLEDNRRFFVAVMLAAIYGMKRFTLREIAASLWQIVRALTTRKGKASDELFEERMATCRACPLYFSKLSTCGSPMAENDQLGCFCYLPLKSRIESARCWLREKTELDAGWLR